MPRSMTTPGFRAIPPFSALKSVMNYENSSERADRQSRFSSYYALVSFLYPTSGSFSGFETQVTSSTR